MSDSVKAVMTACITNGSKLSDLAIKNGQLIFIRDKSTVALDFGGKRTFYNQIIELQTDLERQSLLAPITGKYYFVIETAVLWTYNSHWIQLTIKPQDIMSINDTPEVGVSNKLYISTGESNNISIWDEESRSYIIIADKTNATISNEDIDKLFNKKGVN